MIVDVDEKKDDAAPLNMGSSETYENAMKIRQVTGLYPQWYIKWASEDGILEMLRKAREQGINEFIIRLTTNDEKGLPRLNYELLKRDFGGLNSAIFDAMADFSQPDSKVVIIRVTSGDAAEFLLSQVKSIGG